ncbi:TetR/AcrR family transcriptional regulator [Micromonospora sp. NPDC018662]|uniref:TetR/AcrR family transcriptional regulator n=1 Tax=Micromonospora sp. NPDC018662 TaxID=3364238 RepID=UPI00379CC6E1
MGTTADRLVAIARDLVIAEGPAAVTMRRVAAAAGITPMAIYRHHANREALLRRVADETFDDISKRWADRQPGPGNLIADHLDDHLDFALGQPKLYDFVFTDPREGARRFPDDFRDGGSPSLSLVTDALRNEGFRGGDGDDLLELALAFGALIHGLVRLYHGGRIAMSPAEFRALCHRLVGRMLDVHN